MKQLVCLAAAAVLAALSSVALAGDYKAGMIMVKEPWARVTLQNRPAGGYFMIHNMGKEADKLVGASSPLAERAELHTHTMTDGIMRMHHVDAIELPAKSEVALKPGGFHLMIFGLKEPVAKGGRIPVVLKFEKAGELTVDLTVGAKATRRGSHDGKSRRGSHDGKTRRGSHKNESSE